MQIIIKGNIPGGKNNMGITRAGVHYPKKNFKIWRDATVLYLLSLHIPMITRDDLLWEFFYTPYDRRIKDATAILDAIFHCLERAKIVKNDALIKNINYRMYGADKGGAGMIIQASGRL